MGCEEFEVEVVVVVVVEVEDEDEVEVEVMVMVMVADRVGVGVKDGIRVVVKVGFPAPVSTSDIVDVTRSDWSVVKVCVANRFLKPFNRLYGGNAMSRVRAQLPTSVLYVRRVPTILKTLFKTELMRRGLTIEQVIPVLIEKFLEDPTKFPVRPKTP